MAYSDKDYFLTKINEDTLDTLTGEEDDNLTSAIADADSLIDSYLRTIVSVPIDDPPDIIRRISYDIAIFYLHDRIQYSDIPDFVRDKYDAAISFLKDLSSGKASLNLPETSTSTEETNIESGSNEQMMDREMF